jgi:phosphomannomutase / phosphoglucomutase
MTDSVNPNIFREYDIRGIVDLDLTDDIVQKLGKAFGTYMLRNGAKSLSIGGDVRLSTERFREQLISGLTSTGVDVINIGRVPTPVQYYSMHILPVQAGIMITGSHNPPDYNGFKLTLKNSPVYGDEIQKIREIIETGQYESGKGQLSSESIIDRYMNNIVSNIKIEKPVKVVLDSGNGAGALVAHDLFRKLGVETIDLFDTPDGTFPNHHPDPTVVEYIQELIATVKRTGADLGIGYDGDADRIGVVDENGEIIWGDRLLIIFGREILKNHPGAKVIFDVKCSQALPEMITRFGGEPVMWKTGHSLLKKKMKETGAPLAGEMSGHLFFADRYMGFDDAIYASARMVELVSKSDKKVSQLLNDAPKYFSTPEIRAEAIDDNEKFRIAKEAREYFSKQYKVNDIDGVRILFDDGWGLVRASNTQPVLVLRFEALSQERLDEISDLVISKLKEFGEIKI